MDKWNRDIRNILKKGNMEKLPAVVKRCPVCSNLSLEFDAEQSRVYCTKCGFEEKFPK